MLQLDFNDVPFANPTVQNIVPFNTDMANQIIGFCEALPKNIDWIMIHCWAGISRSAAVAKFLCEKYGERFPSDYKDINQLVYETLKKTITEK